MYNKVLGYNLLIRPSVQLYSYSAINGNFDLSRVDRKAQGPLELVSYWSLLVPLQATHLSPNGKTQKVIPIR